MPRAVDSVLMALRSTDTRQRQGEGARDKGNRIKFAPRFLTGSDNPSPHATVGTAPADAIALPLPGSMVVRGCAMLLSAAVLWSCVPYGETSSGRKTRVTEPTLYARSSDPAIGALIEGVDLSGECSATLLNRLYDLLIEHLVLFFPNQMLTPATLLAFAETFGELNAPHHVYPHVPGYERLVLLENDGDRPAQYRCLAHGSHV